MQLKWTATAVAMAALTLVACGKKEEAAAPAAAPATTTAAAPAAAPPADALIVKIGHVGPTSGPIAHLGKDNEFGAKMAIEDLNSRNLKIGDKVAKFELLAEDDAGDPKQGTAVAQKLVDAKVNGIVGHLNSGTTIPASKLYSDAGIPQISPSATNPKYTRQGFKTTFRVVADDTQLGGTLGKYAVETLKGKNIAVIDDRTAYGQGVAEEFEKAAKAAGGTIVGHEFTTDKSTDFNAILTKLKGTKPDVLFFGGMDAVAGPMLKQVKQLGMTVKFMGGDGLCTGELAKLAGDAIGEDMVVCAEAGGVDGDFKAPLEKFKADFKAKNGVDVQIYAPYVYDAVEILADAMVRAGSSDPAKYLPEVGKTNYKGVTGPIAFDEKGDIKNGALTLYTYKAGKREQIAVVR
ncbi:branched-chain amino acid ABC transporter substrate-binding protein [soil metagenome]